MWNSVRYRPQTRRTESLPSIEPGVIAVRTRLIVVEAVASVSRARPGVCREIPRVATRCGDAVDVQSATGRELPAIAGGECVRRLVAFVTNSLRNPGNCGNPHDEDDWVIANPRTGGSDAFTADALALAGDVAAAAVLNVSVRLGFAAVCREAIAIAVT